MNHAIINKRLLTILLTVLNFSMIALINLDPPFFQCYPGHKGSNAR